MFLGTFVGRRVTLENLGLVPRHRLRCAASEAEADAKAKARVSALAKLKKLGLTAAEIEAL